MAVLPIAITLAALQFMNHWFAIRYVTSALPAYLLLVASGVSALARWSTGFSRSRLKPGLHHECPNTGCG